ncbi:MlaD family protein [Aegicerativicinus sediminis]
MKKSKSHDLKLGFFVILSTALFVVAVYLVGQNRNLFTKSFTVSAYFQNINGLQRGNNVRYSGIDIGMVQGIEMVNDSVIKVTMKIDEKVVEHIHKNAVATIGSDGLVGNVIVNIIPGEGYAEQIENGDEIESYSRIGPDDILNTLNATSDNLALLISGLRKITDKLNYGEGTLGVLLNDTTMAYDLKATSKNLKLASHRANEAILELNQLIASLKSNTETTVGVLLNDTISGRNLKSAFSNLNDTSNRLEQMSLTLNNYLDEIESANGALNYITKDSTLVNEIKSTIDNVNSGTSKFNENMEALKHNFLFRGYFKKLEKKEKKQNEELFN